LFFRRNSADAVTITIDGGAPATFTMNTSVADQVWDSPALTSGSHTVVITRTAGGPSFNGGYFYNGDETAGLAVWDASHTGGKMVDLAVNNVQWLDQLPFANASLLVLTCVTNDCRSSSGGYSAATFKGHAQSVVSLARAKVANLPVLFMPPYEPLGTLIEPWENYTGALKEIVAATPYTALYDMSLTIPDLTSDPYGFLQDTVHPNDLGYAFLGQMAATAMSPR
jgi:lysophospholipase L1-like esterase